jgi:hypothetical protein
VVQVGEVERLTVEGFTYERRGLADPDPNTNWLETLRMPTQRHPAGKRAARSAGSPTTKRKRSSR